MTRAVNPAPGSDPAGEPPPHVSVTDDADESRLVSRLAALDDCLGGRGSADGLAASYDAAEADDGDLAIAETLDAMLLLRQVAAADLEQDRHPILMPATVGRFEVVCEVGRGGFAFVVEAFDPKLCRRVALKVARPEAILSGEIRRRFIREAELTARLVHPHVIAIHEVGESDGLAFIAQELCAGGSLADWLAGHPGPVDPAVAARLVRALADGVAHAHAAGILHRDIKPGNVLLVPTATGGAQILPGAAGGGGWTVKLGDFGLGKLLTESSADAVTQLTRSGSRIGTPAWMAPEQIDRSFGEVGPATDVHALGVLLDRLLTGRSPHDGCSEAETFRRILLQDPVPPDAVNRRVSPDLAAVCLKCLAKWPGDRYASAADVAADLSRHLDGLPTLARPLTAGGRLSLAVARRPVVFALAAAVVGMTVLAGWAMQERSRETAKRAEVASLVRQREAAAELQRGFEAWRIGNVAAATGHLRSCLAIDEDLGRSFATRWLRRRLRGECEILLEPSARNRDHVDLYAFAVASDGRTIAAGAADGTLSILASARDGMPARPPLAVAAHDEINDVAFSPDGGIVATAGQDGRLRVWRVADGSPVRELPTSPAPLFAVAFSPDNAWIAYGGGDRVLRIAPATGPSAVRELRPFDDLPERVKTREPEIESIQFIGDDLVAVACGDRIAIVGRDAGETRQRLDDHSGVVGQLAVSRDGRRLLSAGTDLQPLVWEIASGRRLVMLPLHPSWVQGCDFSPDGTSIVTGCRDGVIRVFDAETGSLRKSFVGHVGRTWDVKYAPDGSILSTGADGTLRRWDPGTRPELAGLVELRLPGCNSDATRGGPAGGVARMTAIPSGPPRAIVVELEGGQQAVVCDTAPRAGERPSPTAISIYEAVADWPRRRFALRPFLCNVEVHRLAESAAAVAGHLSAAAAWSPPPVRLRSSRGLAWTPSGLLLMSREGAKLLAWDGDLARLHAIDQFEQDVTAMAVHDAARPRLAVAAGRIVKVYDLPTAGPSAVSNGRTLVALGPSEDPFVDVAWSSDGGRLACGTNRGAVRVIDVGSGATVHDLAALGREITGIVWVDDGRTLITADTECVRVSDALTATTYDEVRPGWRIEKLSRSFGGPDGAAPIVVIAGQSPPSVEAGDAVPRAAILDVAVPPAREPTP